MAHNVAIPPGAASAGSVGSPDPTLVPVQDPPAIAGIGLVYSTGAGAGSSPPGGEALNAHAVNQPNQYPASDAVTGVSYGDGTGVPGSAGVNPDAPPAGAMAMQVTNPNNFAGTAGGGSGTQMIAVTDAISGPDDWTGTQSSYPPRPPIIAGDFYPTATGAGQGRVLRGGFANGQRS